MGMCEKVYIIIILCASVATAWILTIRDSVSASRFAPGGCGGQYELIHRDSGRGSVVDFTMLS